MARTICIASEKGGVAKSTTTEAFASILHTKGFRVLTVDLDAQPGNLSLHVGADKTQPGAYELLCARNMTVQGVLELVQHTDDFGDVIAGDSMLNQADETLSGRIGREKVLSRALDAVWDEYDYVLIDTPPAIQVRTLNGLCAADDVIIPTTADISSVTGIETLVDTVSQLRDISTHPIRIAGVLICNFNMSTNLDRDMEAALRALSNVWGVPVFDTKVRHTIKVGGAQRKSESLITFAPDSTASRDYHDAVEEYLRRCQ